MDPVLLGAFITGLFAAVVALITVRGQQKAAITAAVAAENKTKIDSAQVQIEGWQAFAESYREEIERLKRERDEERAIAVAFAASKDRLETVLRAKDIELESFRRLAEHCKIHHKEQ